MIPLDRSLVRVGLALGLLTLTALPATAESRDGSYGYFRVIEGSATLMQSSGGSGSNTDRQPAEVNQPVLAGDRIWVPERSRVEIVLADRNILRLDGGSEVILEQLAASPDGEDPATVIRLQDGNILLTVTTDSLGDQLPRVDTPNATIYTQHFGTYRITATDSRFTELTIRRGKAEVVTDRGSQIVKADEVAFVEGERSADIEVESAASFDALERWADKLEGEGRYADNDYIDDDLRYQAAPLARHGSWIQHGGRAYWRPRVEVGWRPYWQGRWAYTPAGLTWVSYEPWGWVPYHYGSWDYLPNYGWAWAPGRQWAPAHVYWYWGPSYAGWCPTGYYTSFYRNRYPYFRSGVYGWAGGSWDHYSHWSFVSHDYFRGYRNGYRNGYKDGRHNDGWDVRRFAVPRDQVRRAGPLERGVITTDTRPLRPDTWNEPRQAIRVLTDQPIARRLERGDRSDPRQGELPDVTPFIQRRPDLPDNVVRTVVPRDRDGDAKGNQAGTRPTVADRPGGGTPWEGGVISTDPSDRSRRGGETPRVRVPEGNVQGTTPNAERPRVGRPQPGQGGGAPRPDSAAPVDRNDRGATPRVRVPETPQQQGGSDTPRARRPEAGSPGGAPRPQVDDSDNRQTGDNDGSSRTRQPRQEEGDRNDEVRSRRPEVGSPGGSPRPSRPESEAPAVRRPDPPRSYDAPRTQERDQDREQESRARQREQQEQEQEMRSRTQERERQQEREQEVRERSQDRERQQEARPERQQEARPAQREREREESARPPERERGSSRGSESRGSEGSGGSGRSSSSRSSRSRPPEDGGR